MFDHVRYCKTNALTTTTGQSISNENILNNPTPSKSKAKHNGNAVTSVPTYVNAVTSSQHVSSNASVCSNNSSGLSRSKCLKKIQKYQTMLWGTEDSSSEESEVFNSIKYIALDSGASTTCVTNINASDIDINLNRNNMEELPTVTAAD